jgi:hypothetical protein
VRENWEIDAMGYESEQELSLRIEDATYAFFGPRVRSDVTIAPGGSIEISLLIIALGAINTYRHHVDNIEWFASHVKSIIKRFLPRPPRGYRVLVAEQQISVPTLPEPQPTAPAPGPASSSTPPPQARADQAQRFLMILAAEMAILVGLAIALLAIYAIR